MYLKSIEIQGFKSFANRIRLEFHSGITAIVGPNGSGKSNIADAVRWVLGEQSAKQLRGGSMQDVIFAGTENRKPLGLASVAITLDNADHKLDIAYEEVTVTRRLYRSGESEYLLNGTVCRLRDINELFYDTGIGKEGYSIIGQGQIDKILSDRPEERRELFDEAAGIVKFKRRKMATQKKLEAEHQNLVRVTDILSELTGQLGPLEKQAQTAQIYLKKYEELKKLEAGAFLLHEERNRAEQLETEKKLTLVRQEFEETEAAFLRTGEEYGKLERELGQLDEQTETLRKEAKEKELLARQMDGQVNVLKEQIVAQQQSTEHEESRLQALAKEIADLRAGEAALLTEQETVKNERLQKEQILREKKERLALLQQENASCASQIEEKQAAVIELLNSRASVKGKMQRYDAMLEQIEIRKSGLQQQRIRSCSEEEQQRGLAETCQKNYETVTASIRNMEEEQRRMEAEEADLRRSIAEKSRKLEADQTSWHRERSRLESVRNLAERYDGFGSSIRRVMEQKDRMPGIHGVVADLIHTEQRYETAIETALGGSIQNIVTDNEQTAKQLIGFLKQKRYGRATFLPLTAVKDHAVLMRPEVLGEPGVVGQAHMLVQTEEPYRALAASLLGRTLVVDNMDHAIAIGATYRHALRMVTLDGELFNPGGSMTGGAFRNSSNLLGRRREIEELTRCVHDRKEKIQALQKQIDGERSRRNVLRDAISETAERIRELRVRQNTEKMNLEQVQEKLKQGKDENSRIRMELGEIDRQVAEINEKHAAIEQEMQDSQLREQELESETEKLLMIQKTLTAEENCRRKDMEEIHVQTAALQQKEEFQSADLQRIRREIRECLTEKETIQTDLGSGTGRIREIEEQIAGLVREMTAADQEAGKLNRLIAEKTGRREDLSGRQKNLFEERDTLSQRKNLLDKDGLRLSGRLEKLKETEERLVQDLWEHYEMTPQEAEQYRFDEIPDSGKLKKRMSDCKEEIRALGPVHVGAIEEYRERKERHTFLETQRADLVKAEQSLQDIIRDLDEGMRRQFAEQFTEIQKEFDRAFRQLFGGGRGILKLSEGEDVLEAGIQIISQPPGKKLQNMMQLSGGEKALTAIALLFAIQNLKPSPFCLLDEIEAALDDPNVTRFAQYLNQLTKNTQFIIITHRRGTMTAADRLYGITMQEKGVSALVSVSLIEEDLDQ